MAFNGAPRLGLGEGLRRVRRAFGRNPPSMGLRDWVSEKAGGLGQRDRRRPHPSMGLRDWVSEKAAGLRRVHRHQHPPSMGLRDWVSEKGGFSRGRRWWRPTSFNGAPRLGLGEGRRAGRRPKARRPSFNGAPRLGLGEGEREQVALAVRIYDLQWGSETGSRRRRRSSRSRSRPRRTFNGAPRLGLGEGCVGRWFCRRGLGPSMGLRDWVSEKGNADPLARLAIVPSMGLRDWVSEKESIVAFVFTTHMFPSMGLRDWVSEKEISAACKRAAKKPSMGLRDWVSEKEGTQTLSVLARTPSMGLRDWVSEKARGRGRCCRGRPAFNGAPRLGLGEGTRGRSQRPAQTRSFNGAPRLGLGEGLIVWSKPDGAASLQWGSETGSRRRDASSRPGTPSGAHLQWGSETGSRRRDLVRAAFDMPPMPSMGLRDWVSEKAF